MEMERIIRETINPKDRVPGIKPPAESPLISGRPVDKELELQYLKTRDRLIEELGIHLSFLKE